jgi:hypothetical protein
MYPKLKINVYFIFLNIGDLTFGITLVKLYKTIRVRVPVVLYCIKYGLLPKGNKTGCV